MSDKKGYSLLEFLAALSLFGLTFGLLSKAATQFAHLYRQVRTMRQNEYAAERARQNFEDALQKSDSHRLQDLLRLHSAGSINYADGSLNPVSLRSDELSPEKNSSALTTVELMPFCILDRVNSPGNQGLFCLRFNQAAAYSKCQSTSQVFLALSLNQKDEALVLNPNSLEGGCLTPALYSPAKSMLSKSQFKENRILSLVPILQSYTLYLDRAGRLRHLSHRGADNIENQPLASNYKSLTLQINQRDTPAVEELLLTLEFEGISPRKFLIYNHLTFQPIDNLLFHARQN